ncbi:uncharacterized protein LOC134207811 [Armigeres subalbatus]|uniref:uncharacterized protein LOC134207811 n=1 Tax=Armigeres subalbatus TaxID=124917 RepID=UPI002ED19E36
MQCINLILFVAILGTASAAPRIISDEIATSLKAYKHFGVLFAGSSPTRNHLPSPSDKVGQQLIYTLGQRVAGDRLVSTKSENKQWPTLQDVTLSLSYPQSGVGAIVTYVQVIVKQSSATGKGYVVSGGIGQRFIHLMIEAYSTTYFNYSVQIFGL